MTPPERFPRDDPRECAETRAQQLGPCEAVGGRRVSGGGRRQIDEAVAAARRFRPQTVRRWPLDKIARSMGTLLLHDPVLAQVILLHRVCAPEHLPMVRSFL